MDIRKIAEQLIGELNAGEAQKKWQAEGVALFYNRMVEVSASEEKQNAAPVMEAQATPVAGAKPKKSKKAETNAPKTETPSEAKQ